MPDTTNSNLCKYRILSEDYRDFIIGSGKTPALEGSQQSQYCSLDLGAHFKCVYVDGAYADPINLQRYSYNAIPNCYTLLDMEAMNQAGIAQIQNYPTLRLRGQGVLIGFIDTGIDYTNPVFRNLNGSTRIEAIWDQTIQTGVSPPGYLFGSVYNREEIDQALESDRPLEIVPSEDLSGHGTFLASIAAGGGVPEQQFLGAAPESAIAVVKLKPAKKYLMQYYFIAEDAPCYQENDIMLALKFLDELASEKNMPLVMCVALGTNLGGHDATPPISFMLDLYSNKSKLAVVTGTGNEANQRHHYRNVVQQVDDIKEVEILVDNDVTGFTLEVWSDIPNIIAVSIVSPTGENIPRIPIRQAGISVYEFVFERTTVFVDYQVLVEKTNSELILLRFDKPAAGSWKIIVIPRQIADGVFHMWLPVQEFLSADVIFTASNPDYTITDPGNTNSPITVGFYNGNDNSIDINSGRGYTRTERIKPDFAAPGVNVLGAGLGGQFVRRSGSSIAVGITSGACALMLEWFVNVLGQTGTDTIEIKNLLILGASRSPVDGYPNRQWGYGKMNLYQTFEEFRRY